MQWSLSHTLARTYRFRSLLESEQGRPSTNPSRLLRLQALQLQAQLRIAEFIDASTSKHESVSKTHRRCGSASVFLY